MPKRISPRITGSTAIVRSWRSRPTRDPRRDLPNGRAGSCAPVYSQMLGLSTEVVVGPGEGLPRVSSVRCDFLALMFKRKLTTFVASLPPRKVEELNRALAVALDLG